MDHPRIVSQEEAFAVRKAFAEEEKEFTRARDALAQRRRDLPWTRVEKSYVFDSVSGPKTLAELFGGRSQLIIQHFMFAPDWQAGCVGCSFVSDHVSAALPHIQARDANFVAVSRAPLEKLLRYRRRMGWTFDWVSSERSDFNRDFGVEFRPEDVGRATYNYRPLTFEASDLPGMSVFFQDASGAVFHTYSTFARGAEMMATAYMYIDILPKGRNEDPLNPPSWWRRHDEYVIAAPVPECGCKSDAASVSFP